MKIKHLEVDACGHCGSEYNYMTYDGISEHVYCVQCDNHLAELMVGPEP